MLIYPLNAISCPLYNIYIIYIYIYIYILCLNHPLNASGHIYILCYISSTIYASGHELSCPLVLLHVNVEKN